MTKEAPHILDVNTVKSRMQAVRGRQVLLDRDVTVLYGVETREINQAVRNNPDKFPDGFLFRLDAEEFADWKSKIFTSNLSPSEKAAIKMGMRRAPYAFTERGWCMLATVLKGQLVTKATSAIVEDIGFDATGKATKVNELDEIGAELAKERGGEE